MARTERKGTRSWAWSVFHRSMPKPAYMIDMDYLECCQYCKETLIIGELAIDVGQHFKPTTILQKLAKRASGNASVVGLLIFFNEDSIISAVESVIGSAPKGSTPMLTEPLLEVLWRYLSESEESIFRITQVYPSSGSEKAFTPRQFYKFLCGIHERHERQCPVALKRFPIFGQVNKEPT